MYFGVDCVIKHEINVLGYVKKDVLSELIVEIGTWYLIAYFLKKIILFKTQ